MAPALLRADDVPRTFRFYCCLLLSPPRCHLAVDGGLVLRIASAILASTLLLTFSDIRANLYFPLYHSPRNDTRTMLDLSIADDMPYASVVGHSCVELRAARSRRAEIENTWTDTLLVE